MRTPATHDAEPLDKAQHSKYRSQVARCLFLSQGRADITFMENEMCQKMSNFDQRSMAKLKRHVRYLKSERQWGQVFSCEKIANEVSTFTDSVRVGCKETRESSSAGLIQPGNHTLKAYTRKHCGEAELYAAGLELPSQRESCHC